MFSPVVLHFSVIRCEKTCKHVQIITLIGNLDKKLDNISLAKDINVMHQVI